MNDASPAPARILIEAGRWNQEYWRDLWRYRELLYFLAWRDVLLRYKQTVLGIAWAVLRPLMSMAVFTVVFGKLAHLPADGGAPYPIFVFAAMLPWQFFANAFSDSSTSVLSNAGLSSKIYFPRLLVPASATLSALVDFGITLLLLAALMVWYGYWPTW